MKTNGSQQLFRQAETTKKIPIALILLPTSRVVKVPDLMKYIKNVY